MRVVLTALALSMMLAGCSSQWVRDRADAEDFSLAKYGCEAQAESKFPVKNEVAQRTVYTDYYESCKKDENCDGDKYKTVKKPAIESYIMDVNKDSRRGLFNQCMNQKGWKSETTWF
ncbi:hypothetical protein FHU10_4154 [Serratia fonticola]|uniref:Lipoprotein n=1 Tax=Serratia fonticola TaxID=47917 RepID=A0A559TA98_SERFO|nr:hypothetical protein [Serratia fonticola]TQI80948.1 hypothetical protein FHU09_3550 [Serratia fonticola]TQI97027.1 hypothetical protein FHU11_2495 [Serratia fonticola]TVZ71523.1 hypothetical protein FHU10_4154 [Serratia fonticola]